MSFRAEANPSRRQVLVRPRRRVRIWMLHRMSSCTPGAGDLEFRDVESKSVMQLQPCCVERAAMCWRLVEPKTGFCEFPVSPASRSVARHCVVRGAHHRGAVVSERLKDGGRTAAIVAPRRLSASKRPDQPDSKTTGQDLSQRRLRSNGAMTNSQRSACQPGFDAASAKSAFA